MSATTDDIMAAIAALREHFDTEIGKVRVEVAELKGRLSEMPTAGQFAALDAKFGIMPQPPEFYELRGRVEEISRRLPTTIAYAPPAQK